MFQYENLFLESLRGLVGTTTNTNSALRRVENQVGVLFRFAESSPLIASKKHVFFFTEGLFFFFLQ